MNPKAKKILKNVRVIILLIFLLLAAVAIHPNPNADGVAIRSVLMNSSASLAGIASPKPTAPPMSRERITSINNIPVADMQGYEALLAKLLPNTTATVRTTEDSYKVQIKPNETGFGLRVYDAPKTNIRKGLDLQGGTRVLLQPEEEISDNDMDVLLLNMGQRLNVYGLSDIVLREAGDLSGNQYILVEIAGSSEEEVKELLAKQGKFEAKIGNKTVFIGGKDITHVCRTAQCAGIDPNTGCGRVEGGYACRFRFAITLTPEAAEKQALLTNNLDIVAEDEKEYLSEKLALYLDDAFVDELSIGADLKGKAVTDISISGSGVGKTEQEALYNALQNMKRLQTILITGSLPVKLNIVKTDNLSPSLGEEFVRNALFVGIMALLAVSVVIFIRYRKITVAIPMIFTTLSEVILLLGLAALIGWNLDLAAIAGIIIAVGTGVDHVVVITDEVMKKGSEVSSSWKEKIKKAFSIIMVAYFTTLVALIPLLFAGAGLLKGFALTTIMGVSFGVFITRPAYAAIVEILLKE